MYVQVLQDQETYSGLDGSWVGVIPDDTFEDDIEDQLSSAGVLGYWDDHNDETIFVTEPHENVFILFNNTQIKVSLAEILHSSGRV